MQVKFSGKIQDGSTPLAWERQGLRSICKAFLYKKYKKCGTCASVFGKMCNFVRLFKRKVKVKGFIKYKGKSKKEKWARINLRGTKSECQSEHLKSAIYSMDIQRLLRPNIRRLQPYACARDEFKGEASVFLDANENPYNAPYNRYPDPLQTRLKERIAEVKGVPAANIFLGNGSDEPIDLLYRAFCEPGTDNVAAIEPTYGMYRVCADVNDVEYRPVLLGEGFALSADALLAAADGHTKLAWLCSPNNPTGNSLDPAEVERVLRRFPGITVVDEAYIDFAVGAGFLPRLAEFPRLVVLQTFSKAWGGAAIRLGMAFASEEIVQVLNKIKYPYNVNLLTQRQALRMLEQPGRTRQWVDALLEERARLLAALAAVPCIRRVHPTDANFVLVQVADADAVYRYLTGQGIIVRNRNRVSLCQGGLRITVGTPEEDDALLAALRAW